MKASSANCYSPYQKIGDGFLRIPWLSWLVQLVALWMHSTLYCCHLSHTPQFIDSRCTSCFADTTAKSRPIYAKISTFRPVKDRLRIIPNYWIFSLKYIHCQISCKICQNSQAIVRNPIPNILQIPSLPKTGISTIFNVRKFNHKIPLSGPYQNLLYLYSSPWVFTLTGPLSLHSWILSGPCQNLLHLLLPMGIHIDRCIMTP